MNDITLNINTRILERLLWIIIALALIGILVWTQWDRITGIGSDSSGKTEETKETEPSKTAAKGTTETEGTTTSTSSDTSSIVSGEAQIVVDKMFFRPDSADSGRIKQINFRILNGLKDFIPTVEVYVYDQEATEKGVPEIIRYDENEKSLKDQVFKENGRISFTIVSGIESLKTLEVVLKDENDNVLDVITQTFKPSSLDIYRN